MAWHVLYRDVAWHRPKVRGAWLDVTGLSFCFRHGATTHCMPVGSACVCHCAAAAAAAAVAAVRARMYLGSHQCHVSPW